MKRVFSILALIPAFHGLFFQASMGLNAPLFTVLVLLAIAYQSPQSYRRTSFRWVAGAWVLSSIAVLVHNSLLSQVVYWLSFVVSWAYLLKAPSRFWLFGLIESGLSFFSAWWSVISPAFGWKHLGNPHSGLQFIWRKLRLLSIPTALLIPFYLLYQRANTSFQHLNEWLSSWLNPLWTLQLDGAVLAHLLLATLLITAALAQRRGIPFLHQLESRWRYKLRRQRRPFTVAHKLNGLRTEYRIAIMSFAALNGLLLLINTLDLRYVWFSRQVRTASELSQYVHEGTWLLILSILLAIAVVVVFLRANLNFYPQSTPLKRLIYLWLGQNALLAVSVGIRNGHYIKAHQLAEGRIVVFFFLAVCLYGLYTVYRKVAGPRTTYYLLQYNGWAIGVALLLSTAVNWSNFITSYNLRHASPDFEYLYFLDNNLLALLQPFSTPTAKEQQEGRKDYIAFRCHRHISAYEAKDWRAWNWSDYQQYVLAKDWLANNMTEARPH